MDVAVEGVHFSQNSRRFDVHTDRESPLQQIPVRFCFIYLARRSFQQPKGLNQGPFEGAMSEIGMLRQSHDPL